MTTWEWRESELGAGVPVQNASGLRGLVRVIDREIPPPEVATVESRLSGMLALPRFNTVALTLFAALALVLASVGLFGVLSYTVARRTRKIGVRVALGALDGNVRALVVRQGMLSALAGLVSGCIIARFATRVLSSLLYGVTPRDALACVAAALVLTVTALAAVLHPRAARNEDRSDDGAARRVRTGQLLRHRCNLPYRIMVAEGM